MKHPMGDTQEGGQPEKKIETVQGIAGETRRRTTRQGRAYAFVALGDSEYTVWSPELITLFETCKGGTIEATISWTDPTRKRIESIKPLDIPPPIPASLEGAAAESARDGSRLRVRALELAIQFMSTKVPSQDPTPDIVVAAAREFESYLLGLDLPTTSL